MSTTAPTTHRTTPAAGRHVRLALLALLVAVLGVTGTGTTSASAATFPTGAGAYGGVTPRGVHGTITYYKAPTAITGGMVPALNVTGPVVTRSAATSGAQTVHYTFAIYQYVNRTWVKVYSSWTNVEVIPQGYSSLAFNPTAVHIQPGGYYRVTFGLGWFDAYGRGLGSRTVDYAHAGDYLCQVSVCSTGPGWIYR